MQNAGGLSDKVDVWPHDQAMAQAQHRLQRGRPNFRPLNLGF